MNNNRRNEPEFWFDDRYGPRGQNRENYHPEQDPHYANRNYQDERWPSRPDENRYEPRGSFSNEHRQSNRSQEPGSGYGYEYHHEWQQNRSPYHSSYGDSRYGSRQSGGYNSGRYGMPENRHNDQNLYGTRYGRGGENWGYSGSEPPHAASGYSDYRNAEPEAGRRHTSLGVGAVGGSFTEYSASRSRRGAMGHSRPNNVLHREGPGMNSYSHGDINANSNW